jgi:glycosyltransferase involved in cell wall biosynthesis
MKNELTHQKKHIVLDARGAATTTGRYHQNLIREIAARDTNFRFTILLNEGDRSLDLPAPSNSNIVYVDIPWYSMAEQKILPRVIHSLKPDLVHYLMPQQPLAFNRGVKTVTTIHDLTLVDMQLQKNRGMKTRLKSRVFALILRKAARSDGIICDTNYVKAKLIERYPRLERLQDAHVIPLAAEVHSHGSKPLRDFEKIEFCMYVGNFSEHKNIKLMLEGFLEARKSWPELKLLMIGKATNYSETLRAGGAYEQAQGVEWLGFVGNDELAWCYEHATATICASLSEGFGLPGLEAMQYGSPLLSSNATCLPEVYKDGPLYFDPLKQQELSAQILKLKDNPSLRDELILRGRKVAKSYSWGLSARQTLNVYESLVKD